MATSIIRCLHLRFRQHPERWVWEDGRSERVRMLAVRLTVSPRDTRSYSHEVSPAWVLDYDPNKDNLNRHADRNGNRAH